MLQRKKEVIETHSRNTADGRKNCVTDPRKLRRYPIGAELIGANETHFRVWAPKATRVDVVLEESAAKNATGTQASLTEKAMRTREGKRGSDLRIIQAEEQNRQSVLMRLVRG